MKRSIPVFPAWNHSRGADQLRTELVSANNFHHPQTLFLADLFFNDSVFYIYTENLTCAILYFLSTILSNADDLYKPQDMHQAN